MFVINRGPLAKIVSFMENTSCLFERHIKNEIIYCYQIKFPSKKRGNFPDSEKTSDLETRGKTRTHMHGNIYTTTLIPSLLLKHCSSWKANIVSASLDKQGFRKFGQTGKYLCKTIQQFVDVCSSEPLTWSFIRKMTDNSSRLSYFHVFSFIY